MDQKREPETEARDRPSAPVRKPWHAPRFIETGLAATDTMCNAGADANPGSLS
jgi:hypothetical protein